MGPKIINILKSKGIQLVARLFLGGIFIYASIDKIAYPDEFARIVQNYDLVPRFLVRIIAYLLPWIELIVGIFLVIGIFVRKSAFFLSFMLLMFMTAIIFKWLNGTIENCGCFSTSSTSSHISIISFLFRDILLLLFGLILILPIRLKKLDKISTIKKL